MPLTRKEIGHRIHSRLQDSRETLERQWKSSGPINHFVLDDLLPEEWARQISAAFPHPREMVLKKSLRELKYVAAQMDKYNPILEESVYAFQLPEVITAVHKITGLEHLEPDEQLYAGGISTMTRGHFLNPHIDNSHDKHRRRYRVLNLLYYVSPDWTDVDGASLELWPEGPKQAPTTIVSRFNRLVAMVTHQTSWHSVSPNQSHKDRCCVSNYYFSKSPVEGVHHFHVTSFRGRPNQRFRDALLRTDIWLRMTLRKLFPLGVRQNPLAAKATVEAAFLSGRGPHPRSPVSSTGRLDGRLAAAVRMCIYIPVLRD
jgi:Rps23 Pro-64 3,4-dihydroxylase Tpa1-like proline 4-hydroxylase